MAAAIGGRAAGMDAVGSLLARNNPGGAGASGSGPSATAPASAGQMPPGAPGMDAQQDQVMATMNQIRMAGQAVRDLLQIIPDAAQEVQQIQELLKQIVIKAAAPAPMTTGSSMAVPGTGGGV